MPGETNEDGTETVQTPPVTGEDTGKEQKQETQQQGKGNGEQKQDQQGKTVILPTATFGRLKAEAREKGKKEILAALGVSSLDEARAVLEAAKKAPKPQLKQDQKQQEATDKNAAKLARDREREAAQRRAESEQRRRKDAEEAKLAVEAELELTKAAAAVGVKDIDYAMHLLRRHTSRMTEEECKVFDDRAYFEGLHKTHPHVFGEVIVPATTGTGTGNTPPKPTPEQVTKQNGGAGKKAVKDMSKQEFHDHLRSMGLDPSSVTPS
jgi:hypothetical protein